MSTLWMIFLAASLCYGCLAFLVFLAQGLPRSTMIATPALLLAYMALGRHDHS